MNRGTIKIRETEHHGFIVEVQTADGNLWLTQHEIADLFNVTISSISNSLYSIFKSGMLKEKDVTQTYLFDQNGKQCQTTLYNLEIIIFVSYRIASGEARVFRQWVMKIICKNTIDVKRVYKGEVMMVNNLVKDLSIISILN